MSDESFERLITDFFQLTGHSIRGFTLRANYGDGYAEGAVIGHAEGLQTWKLKFGVLPDVAGEDLINAGAFGLQTRARYLWDFYVRHNVANAFKPFRVKDPVSGRDYLAEIVEGELDYEVLCRTAFSTGLTLRQRRVRAVESVGGPGAVENNAEI